MKHYLTMILAGWSMAANAEHLSEPGNLSLHYDAPASDWQSECLPIGNGQMGAMLFGQVDQERIQFNEESLWIGNEDDTGAYQNFGEVQMMFDNGGPTVTNPSNHVSAGTQSILESADGKRETKWCMEHGGRFPIIWQMTMTAKAPAITSYTITSAEDVPERDPKAWRFLGSTDGVAWTVLDERKDVPVWPDRLSPRSFPVKNQTAYPYYRLEFLETHNVPHFQVAEIALGTADAQEKKGPQNYRRELDLNQAVHRVTYENNGVQFTREAFASFPAKVIAVHVTASKPGALSGIIALTDAHEKGYSLVYNTPPVPSTAENFQTDASADPAELAVRGFFPGYQYDGGKNWLPLHREARLRILHEGGKLTVRDGKLEIEKADSLTLLLAAGTDFLQDRSKNWRGPLPHAAIAARLDAAAKKSYAELRAEHVRDYRRLFDRVTLSLGGNAAPTVPTNLRLKQYDMKQPDLGLEELMFQYGRYLLISSSREGGLPANLQGKWNNNNAPAWRCDYHTDVNLEMNYWLADVANLGECFQPFADWIHSIRAVRTEATKTTPFFPACGPVTGSFNGLHRESNFLAASLYQYNFVPDMGVFREQTKPHSGRHYALAGDGGLVMATWPHGGLPEQCKNAWQFMYFQECMSGFEHSAAALMVSLAKDESDPLLTQGLTVCRAIHDRYDASRRNPYNEIECSDHYARAMASFGVFIAATGFHCHAGQGLLRFEPKIGAKDFAGPFIGAGAWGRFSQKHDTTGLSAALDVRFGSLRLTRLELTAPAAKAATSSVTIAGKAVPHRVESADGLIAFVLEQPVTLGPGQMLEVKV